MSFLLIAWNFLKSIPPRAWAIILALALLFTAIAVFAEHERAIGRAQDAATITSLKAQIGVAQAVNASNVDTVHKLQASLQQCEAGRTLDQKLTADAKDAYDKQLKTLLSGARDASARTAQLLAGDCKVWAQQPACGVVP